MRTRTDDARVLRMRLAEVWCASARRRLVHGRHLASASDTRRVRRAGRMRSRPMEKRCSSCHRTHTDRRERRLTCYIRLLQTLRMQKSKSHRHVIAAEARWRAAANNAQADRDLGVDDVPMWHDAREPIEINLRPAGYLRIRLEPRLGYVAWRVIDADSGDVLHCAAIKEALRWIASQVPRQLGSRHWC